MSAEGGKTLPRASVTSLQMIEAGVSGPDTANRLYICTGTAWLGRNLFAGEGMEETFTFYIGNLKFERLQFHRATATASVTGLQVKDADPAATHEYGIAINSIDADRDDESGQVEVRVELKAHAGPGVELAFETLTFQATVLAEV